MKIRSINVKVVSIIIAILGASVAVSILISVRNQRTNLLDETEKNLTVNSAILNNVVRNIMLSGEAPIARSTLRDLKNIQEFDDIEIYRTDGTNAFSDAETIELVNEYIGEDYFTGTERAEKRTIDTEGFQRTLESNTPVAIESPDERAFDFYFPILNLPECRDCHGYGDFIRGVAHYKVSTAGIYERIAGARNTLALFFVAAGLVIAGAMIVALRRTIINPLLVIGSTVTAVGEGNLEKSVELDQKDELGTLASEINSMIVGLKEKSRLEVQNSVIEARNEENRKYLENINEGLLLINRDHTISDQYSTFLETLFQTDSIAGRTLSEFIYPDHPDDSAERREIDELVDLIFDNIRTDMEMIQSINPLQNKTLVVGTNENRKEIVIDTMFQRVVNDGRVENVMVIFEDKTDLVRVERELEHERARSESELEQIQAILRSGPEAFVEFAEEAEKALKNLDDNIDNLNDTDTIKSLFRELHSLKGTARYMELKNFATRLNEAETLLADIRDGNRTADDAAQTEIREILDQLYAEAGNIRKINNRFKEFASQDAMQKQFAGSIRGFFDNLQRMTDQIAEELGKSVRLRTSTDFDTIPFLGTIRDPIIHLIRNAIDHGIEEGVERVSVGKDDTGTIQLRFTEDDSSNCVIEIVDDGAGIDFDSIRKAAIQKRLLSKDDSSVSQQQLVRILFLPAFSSREEATELSGRGVGLDVVHDTVKKLGGTVSVASKPGVGTRFSLRIPLQGES